jgi:hypothetical protein
MTETDAIQHPDDELFDRIVDGTLSPEELRAAIDRLDCLPDGWKRCAAAFLEAQYWRDSFRSIGESTAVRPECGSWFFPGSHVPARGNAKRWFHVARAAGVVAASFAIGWLSHGARLILPAGSTTSSAPASTRAHPQADSRPLLAAAGPADTAGPSPSAERPFGGQALRIDPAELVGTVARLRIAGSGNGTDIPILAGPGITEEWLENQPPPLTEQGQVVLERHGYQVDQSRRLITTDTPDGRRVTVPIDQVQIRYTGNQSL